MCLWGDTCWWNVCLLRSVDLMTLTIHITSFHGLLLCIEENLWSCIVLNVINFVLQALVQHLCSCTHTHTYGYTHTHTYIQTHTHICTHTHIFTHTHTSSKFIQDMQYVLFFLKNTNYWAISCSSQYSTISFLSFIRLPFLNSFPFYFHLSHFTPYILLFKFHIFMCIIIVSISYN